MANRWERLANRKGVVGKHKETVGEQKGRDKRKVPSGSLVKYASSFLNQGGEPSEPGREGWNNGMEVLMGVEANLGSIKKDVCSILGSDEHRHLCRLGGGRRLDLRAVSRRLRGRRLSGRCCCRRRGLSGCGEGGLLQSCPGLGKYGNPGGLVDACNMFCSYYVGAVMLPAGRNTKPEQLLCSV